jgi:hypothetical protein
MPDKGWSSSLQDGHEAKNPSSKNTFVTKQFTDPQAGMDSLDKQNKQ